MCYELFACVSPFVLFIFFFKQKTAYEMRISDWSSDVCSSDLFRVVHACWDNGLIEPLRGLFPDACIDEHFLQASAEPGSFACTVFDRLQIGRASGRERVCQYV